MDDESQYCPLCEQAQARIKELEAEVERINTIKDNYYVLAAELALQNQAMSEALEKLACLGNGDSYGNSVGNCIAQTALNQPNIAAEVMVEHDAKVLHSTLNDYWANGEGSALGDFMLAKADELTKAKEL